MHDIKFDGKCHINAKLCRGPAQLFQPATVWLKIWKYSLDYLCRAKPVDLLSTSVDSVKETPPFSMRRLSCATTVFYFTC